MSTGRRPVREYDLQHQIFVIGLIIGGALLIGLLLIALVSPPRAAMPASATGAGSPNAQTVLSRAEDAATLALTTSEQTARSIELVTNVTTILGTVLGALIIAATAIAGFFGLSNQRELREERERMRDEESKVQALEMRLSEQAQEFENERRELQNFKAQVQQDFKQTRRALTLLELGNRLYDEGKRKQSLDIYEEAMRLDSENAEIFYRLGRAYMDYKRVPDAIAAFGKALALMPNFVEAHKELGVAYRLRADTLPHNQRAAAYGEAEQSLRQAVVRRPDYADALATLGGVYRRLGNYDEALKYYLRTVDADPTWSYGPNNIASLYRRLGKDDLARRYFEASERLALDRIDQQDEHRHWAYYDLALAHLVLGKPGALAAHQEAIRLTPAKDNFCSVLENLRMLRQSPTPIQGLDEFIRLVEAQNSTCPSLGLPDDQG